MLAYTYLTEQYVLNQQAKCFQTCRDLSLGFGFYVFDIFFKVSTDGVTLVFTENQSRFTCCLWYIVVDMLEWLMIRISEKSN